MHEEKKNGKRAAAALALCLCVMGLTSFFAVKSSLNRIPDSDTAVTDNSTAVAEQKEAAIQTPVVDSQGDNSPDTENSGGTSPETGSRYVCPVSGPVQLKYSMDSLVYSKTLDQYMTHPGVDISADMSAEVIAIADGTVSKVYNDDRYGITVCISHGDGLISIYSNLAEQGLAETGDEVKQGQTIGCIGDTALFESLEESHLHFEMTKDSNNTDPGEYIESLQQ